jgi:hypothetical protein
MHATKPSSKCGEPMEGMTDCAAAMSKRDQRCILVTMRIDHDRVTASARSRRALVHRFLSMKGMLSTSWKRNFICRYLNAHAPASRRCLER